MTVRCQYIVSGRGVELINRYGGVEIAASRRQGGGILGRVGKSHDRGWWRIGRPLAKI